MHKNGLSISLLVTCLFLVLAGAVVAAEADKLEKALSEVRDVKADLHSCESSVLGKLASPAEMAAHQMRCRPAPQPKAGVKCEIDFDANTIQRAAKLSPDALYKGDPRFHRAVLPLGITGAYFKESLGRVEPVIVHVLDDSPAGGILTVGDIIIGANGRLFEEKEDPRPEMGNALLESQSPELGGILALHVVRDKKPINVKVNLGSTLSFSDTWPMSCEKTKQMRQAALEYVIKSYPWGSRDFWTPTFLLASGDDAALELARRHLCDDLKDKYEQGEGGSAWGLSYKLINLCEYYLLTGDSSVLPAIRYNAECVSWAQYRSGSWSHGGGRGPHVSEPGTVSGGYGEINCAGLGAFVSLCLARQCGIVPYDHTLPRSVRFFGEFCGTNFPYGLGRPGTRGGRMDNGMNSMAAVGFHLLGEQEMAKRWARSVCYMWMGRECGHAEAIFSGAWGPVGAALAPAEEFHAFMNNMKWSYELSRGRDGSITFMRGGRWEGPNMTAAMGLFLYLPEKRLQILGGDSVFAHKPPAELKDAAWLFRQKRWKELKTSLDEYIASKTASSEDLTYARKLLDAYNRMERHAEATLKIIEQSIRDGQLATAKLQLDLLAKMLGEERFAAARLRQSLEGRHLVNARREKAQPLVDEKKIISSLKLSTTGVDNGFGPGGEYRSRMNMKGYEGMSPEQVARFFDHPNDSPFGAAVKTLADRGQEVVPFLKKLLKDTHPGVLEGALDTLALIYKSDSEEYRTDVSPQEAEVIKLVQPLTKDPRPNVRNAAGGVMLSMKVINDDVCNVLRDMAKLEGSNIMQVVRYGVKDPALRTELCMELVNTANWNKSQVPATYGGLGLAAGPHMEYCKPYLQTAVDTVKNPAVLTLYGFFSDGPPRWSLRILSHYHDNPLVWENLADIIRFSVRMQKEPNFYFGSTTEYPQRVVVQLGPKAIPVVEQVIKEEAEYYRQIEAGEVEQPVWWHAPEPAEDSKNQKQMSTPGYFRWWRGEMETTIELIKCLNGMIPREQAIAKLCEIYLSNRSTGAWERQQIRNCFTRLGPEAAPLLRQTVTLNESSPWGKMKKEVAALQAEYDAAPNNVVRDRTRNRIKPIAEAMKRYEEIAEQAALIEALHSKQPSAEVVQMLCSFYVRRPWGRQRPYEKEEWDYLRPFYEEQLAAVRDTLQRWGEPILPQLRNCLEAEQQRLSPLQAQLDKEEKYWSGVKGRGASWPLKRIAMEREDIKDVRAELAELVDAIAWASAKRLSNEQVRRLCEIYTRRGWTSQNKLILETLKAAGRDAKPAIRDHIGGEKKALPEIQGELDKMVPKAADTSTRWRYVPLKTLKGNIERGIGELAGIVE